MMNAEQKIKQLILIKAHELAGCILPDLVYDHEDIDEYYADCESIDYLADYIIDARNEVRAMGIETNLPCDSSRCYEAESVATQALDGSWVGWTYWHGGGKHGCAQELDWIEHAYDLDVKEKEEIVVTRTFVIKSTD